MQFATRQQAGLLLGEELFRQQVNGELVFGLARGGVVVAAEVARLLQLPLAVLVVRKIGAPHNPEFALGAVAEIPGIKSRASIRRTVVWWDAVTVEKLQLSPKWMEEQVKLKSTEADLYRRQIGHNPLTGKSRLTRAIVVDDGAATGVSMMAAVAAIKTVFPAVIVGLPVASREAVELLQAKAARVYALKIDRHLSAVGQYYHEFGQVSWEEVRRLIE